MLVTIRSLEAEKCIWIAEKLAEKARRLLAAENRDPHTWWVTELLYCPRMQYLRRKEPRPPSVEYLIVMEEGKAVHRLVEEVVGGEAETEVSVEQRCEDVVIRGRADIVFRDTVVEVKTVAEVPPSNDLVEEHGLQAWFYAAVLVRKHAEILYVSRATGELYPVPAPGGTHAVRVLCDRARMLAEFLEKGEEPPGLPGPWCRWCPYKFNCPY